jgi:hypothetical protein
MSEDQNGTPAKRGLARAVAELGPAWVSAFAALLVALTGAGFFVGHVTASGSSGSTPTPVPLSSSAASRSSAGTRPTASTSPAPATQAATVANGTQLASYSFDFPQDFSVPIGLTKPTRTQFNNDGIGDLSSSSAASGDLGFGPVGSDQMLSLPAGSTPTYQTCANDTVILNDGVSAAPGTAFCLVEAGRIAGVTVVSDDPGYQVLDVTLWQNVS